MTPADAVARLRGAGLNLRADDVQIETRGDAVVVRMPGDRLAWFPCHGSAAVHLAIENKLLSLLAARCRFPVPAVLFNAPEGWTIRSLVPGTVDPHGLAARLKAEPPLVARLARDLARILADQHRQIHEADVAGWLPAVPNWPMPRETMDARLPGVVEDGALRVRIARMLDAHDAVAVGPQDRVLVHTDFGLHNLPFDHDTCAIQGIFDYRDAAYADRHLDFRYLVFSAVPDALLDATIQAYGEATGVGLNRNRILLYNAAAAVSHLAFRSGTSPHEVVGGRTLSEDLGWTGWALRRAGF